MARGWFKDSKKLNQILTYRVLFFCTFVSTIIAFKITNLYIEFGEKAQGRLGSQVEKMDQCHKERMKTLANSIDTLVKSHMDGMNMLWIGQ